MKNGILLAVPTTGDRGMKETVSDIFAKAPTFTFIDIVDEKVTNVRVEENTASQLKQGTGPIVMKNLKDKGVDIVVAGELGPGAKTLLEFSNIKMIHVERGLEVSQAVERVLEEIRTGTSVT